MAFSLAQPLTAGERKWRRVDVSPVNRACPEASATGTVWLKPLGEGRWTALVHRRGLCSQPWTAGL